MNEALKYLFNKIYNNGNLTKIIISKRKISELNTFYKNNFETSSNFFDFKNKLGILKKDLEKSHSAFAEFQKQFDKNMALQPAILSECFIAQTLANILNLEHFIDTDEKLENIPSSLFEGLIRAKDGNLESSLPRYIYYGKRKGVVLLQYGGSSSIDAVFVKDGYRVRLEIKEEKAKLGEYDLDYNEDGKLIPTQNILKHHKEYLEYINKFNSETNVFDYIGRNYKIGDYMSDEFIFKVISSVFNLKNIDMYILQKKDIIFAVPSKMLLNFVNVNEGSEIRTAGRNAYDVFTPNRLLDLIHRLGGSIDDANVTLPYDPSKATLGRGKKTITRYKLNSLFFVKYEDVIIDDNNISFPLDKVKQNKATISLHLYSSINKSALLDIYNEIN